MTCSSLPWHKLRGFRRNRIISVLQTYFSMYASQQRTVRHYGRRFRRFHFIRLRMHHGSVRLRDLHLYNSILEKNLQLGNNY